VEDFFIKKSVDFIKIKYAMKFQYELDRHAEELDKIKVQVKDPDSLFIDYIRLNTEIKDAIKNHGGILNIFESIKNTITDAEVSDYIAAHPENDFKAMKTKITTTYPLLSYVNYYASTSNFEPIVHYINLIDKDLKN
jgi:hypothetical protein